MITLSKLRATIFSLVVILGSSIATSQDEPLTTDVSTSELRAQSLAALNRGEPKQAIAAADAMIRLSADDPRTVRLAGDIYLRAGEVDAAVKQFDRYVEMEPQSQAELWQRGIALFFAGDYEKAAKQFEEHRRVNPHDVENAAWHYLCVAKAKSPAEAKKELLAAPSDPRPPMAEIMAMLETGNIDPINTRVSELTVGSPSRDEARFYADLYIGLYADAQGEPLKARKYVARSAEKAPHHYMGDVARVYAKLLEKK